MKFGKYSLVLGLSLFLIIGASAFFTSKLAIGIMFLIFLTGCTLFFFKKNNPNDRTLFLVFLVALLIHALAVLFIYYTNFQPFGDKGGDFVAYNQNAQEIAKRVRHGNFSLEGITLSHYYSVLIGYLYALTIPDMLIGQLFNAWLVVLMAVLAYLISIEIGSSKEGAFLVGVLVSLYPSLLFFGSLLLKDALVGLLTLIALLLTLRMVKQFSWSRFGIFFLLLFPLVHLRFYIGYVAMGIFLLSWVLFAQTDLKKRFLYLPLFIFLLGFVPKFAGQQGYWGIKPLQTFLNPRTITYYKEEVYSPPPEAVFLAPQSVFSQEERDKMFNTGSTYNVQVGFENPLIFLRNFVISFIYTGLGPFPWQIKYARHLFILLEIIPWYLLFFLIMRGLMKSQNNYRMTYPLVLFAVILFGVLALFINNFGIITRIRIPAFIALLCILPLGLGPHIQFFLEKVERFFPILYTRNAKRLKML